MHAETGNAITIRFALPAADLRPFVTTYYYTEVIPSPSEPMLEDYLHPEWANLRFMEPGFSQSAIGDAPLETTPAFAVTGPTSRAAQFRVCAGRSWGIGLMPLGWAYFCDAPASDYADRVVDGMTDRAFARLRPLAHALSASEGGFGEELAIIERHMAEFFQDRAANRFAQSDKIEAVNEALVDPELSTVAQIAERVNMNVRSLERFTKRAFGFPPKLLMRRQRFLRSLAQFMLDPSLKWLNTLDSHYHDQAHFVRDFRRFMGMSPSDYAKLDKPVLIAAARARMAIAGEAVQGLARPAQTES